MTTPRKNKISETTGASHRGGSQVQIHTHSLTLFCTLLITDLVGNLAEESILHCGGILRRPTRCISRGRPIQCAAGSHHVVLPKPALHMLFQVRPAETLPRQALASALGSRGGVERATGWATGLATREVTLSAMSPEMLVEMRSTGEGEVRQVASAQRTSG